MQLKNDKGVTGVDVAISIVVLMTFVSLVAAMFSNIAITNKKVERKSISTHLAIQIIEAIKTVDFEDLNSTEITIEELNALAGSNINIPNGYVAEITIDNYLDEDIIKTVSAQITYLNGKQQDNVKLETLIKNVSY